MDLPEIPMPEYREVTENDIIERNLDILDALFSHPEHAEDFGIGRTIVEHIAVSGPKTVAITAYKNGAYAGGLTGVGVFGKGGVPPKEYSSLLPGNTGAKDLNGPPPMAEFMLRVNPKDRTFTLNPRVTNAADFSAFEPAKKVLEKSIAEFLLKVQKGGHAGFGPLPKTSK